MRGRGEVLPAEVLKTRGADTPCPANAEQTRHASAPLPSLLAKERVKRSSTLRVLSSSRLKNAQATRGVNDLIAGRERRLISEPNRMTVLQPAAAESSQQKWILHHDSMLRMAWDLFLLILLSYVAVMTPFSLAFAVPPSGFLWYWEVTIDFIFMFDVCLNFRTSYERNNGEEELRPRYIALHYVRTWFMIDVVSSVPIELLLSGGGELRSLKVAKASKLLRVLRLLKLTKLLRMLKARKALEIIEEYLELSQEQAKGIKLLISVFFIAHFIACGWGFLGTQVSQSTEGCLPNGASPSGSACFANWLARFEDEVTGHSLGTTDTYVAALYWSLTTITTVGYGDIVPHSAVERLYTVFAMITAVAFYGYFIGAIAAIMQNLDANEAKYVEKMGAITSYMKQREFPKALRLRVKRYYKNYYQQKTALDESVILSELSTFLRREVAMFLLSDIIYTIPFFKGRDPDVLAKVLTILKPIAVMPGDSIMERGEPGSEMFIVCSGTLSVMDDAGATQCLLGKGAFFGEMQLFGVCSLRTATIRADEPSELHALARSDLLEQFRNSPGELDDMQAIAEATYDDVHGETDGVPRQLTCELDDGNARERCIAKESNSDVHEARSTVTSLKRIIQDAIAHTMMDLEDRLRVRSSEEARTPPKTCAPAHANTASWKQYRGRVEADETEK